MADMVKTIKNGLAIGGQRPPIARNADGVYSGRKTPYFATPQNRIASLYGKYADNCYDAELQGYDPQDFYKFWPVQIRCEDVSREATGTNLSDDVKGMVVYYPEGVNYVPIGAHVVFASSTWLVTNPANISAILTESIIRRCNAMYNRLDWYGNVVSCPFSLSKVMPRGAQDDYTKTMILADHYFTCYMQLNEVSAAIHENTRMILGDAAYSVRGLDNFTREFTDDGDSTHILYFQIQREEKTEVYDDMTRKVADGLAFTWEISLAGFVGMMNGQEQTILPSSTRNGRAVVSTTENPISYLWESSDTSVLEIDENGVVTAVGEGSATITCTLAQNEQLQASMEIGVETPKQAYVAFSGRLPDSIEEQSSASFSAVYYENGQPTQQEISFGFAGPHGGEYSTATEGNTVTVYCWERSDTPLVITAECAGEEATHTVSLDAWTGGASEPDDETPYAEGEYF